MWLPLYPKDRWVSLCEVIVIFLCICVNMRVNVIIYWNSQYSRSHPQLWSNCVSLEIKMTRYPIHYKNCWSNIFPNQGTENNTIDLILLSSTKKVTFYSAKGFVRPSGLLQHCVIILMLLLLHVPNPPQGAYGAKSAVVPHHNAFMSHIKRMEKSLSAQVVISYCSKPFSRHKSRLSLRSLFLGISC